MNLVIFEDAAFHICKIVRIISFVQGHALLVGTGGSGRTSLATLAAFIQGYDVSMIQQGTNWSEQLKLLMQVVGTENKKTVFLVNDT